MKRVWIVMTAVFGFTAIWLGLPSDIDPVGRNLAVVSDEIQMGFAQAEKSAPEVTPQTPVETESAGEACLPKSALDDLVKRRKELEKREAELASREQELGSREKATQEELKKIQEVRAEIEKVQGVKTKESEEKIARTVEVLETMNPKAASQVISTYDERLAVQAMARMSTPKLSKILNLMETKRSVRLMELMAGGGTPAGSAEASVPNTNAVTK